MVLSQVGYLVVYVWDAVWNSFQLHAVEGPLFHAVCRDSWTRSFEQHMWYTLLHYGSSRYQCLYFNYVFNVLWNLAWYFSDSFNAKERHLRLNTQEPNMLNQPQQPDVEGFQSHVHLCILATDPQHQQRFEHWLCEVNCSDGISLLTALAQMATPTCHYDPSFITTITLLIYQVCQG